MTKLTSRLVTGIALLGLAAPVLATTPSTSGATPQAKVAVRRHHKRVAAADESKDQKEGAKVEKKASGNAATKSAPKAETKAAPAASSVPAAAPAPAATPAK